jgi:excisionase family DNA binding protein
LKGTPLMKTPELLNRREAAQYLGVSVRTLDNWRADARYLSYTKYANQVKYKREDLDAFIANSTRKVAC